jgi:hypothetical protein
MIHLLIPNSLCNGYSAISAIDVVQLGFAISFLPRAADMLISGTYTCIAHVYEHRKTYSASLKLHKA